MNPLLDRESMMVSRLETILNRPLNPEEKATIEQWDRGRTFSQIVHTDSWTVLLDSIRSYRDGAIEELIRLAPGSPEVMTAHAAASALNDFFVKFQVDVDNSIQASMQTPPVLVEAARKQGGVPPDSM